VNSLTKTAKPSKREATFLILDNVRSSVSKKL
jgi:hypothetical protein